MDLGDWAGIIAVIISGIVAVATTRSSSKASKEINTEDNRVEMEKDAYVRARALDTETIARQDAQIDELRQASTKCDEQIKQLKTDHDRELGQLRSAYEEETSVLRERIARLERSLSTNIEELLRERLEEPDSPDV